MKTTTITKAWADAIAVPEVAKLAQKIRSQWPLLPFPLLIEIVLREWANSTDHEGQGNAIIERIGVDPAEAAADAADAGEGDRNV